jgi:hypothetical protein
MATLETIFKIQDTDTKLYSTGGYSPKWTRDGKSWKTRAQLKSSLKLYMRGQYPGESKAIPDTWTVVELKLVTVKRVRARELFK